MKEKTKSRDSHGRFLKGFKPWHTGTKGIFPATAGCFKKGQTPWNSFKVFVFWENEIKVMKLNDFNNVLQK